MVPDSNLRSAASDSLANNQPANASIGINAKNRSKAMALAVRSVLSESRRCKSGQIAGQIFDGSKESNILLLRAKDIVRCIFWWRGELGRVYWHLARKHRTTVAKERMAGHQETIFVKTRGAGLENITSLVADVVGRSRVELGLCTVFLAHTSASLIIQENADPAVLRDLERWMSDLAPQSRAWEHDDEGPDDMPAHARSALTRSSESIPINHGRLTLGTWQGIYLWEHRARAHQRRIVVHIAGD
jgi:secondary thiamine-phosphate synthase enzyme